MVESRKSLISPLEAVIGQRSTKHVKGGDVVGAESVEGDRELEHSRDQSQRHDPESGASRRSIGDSQSSLRRTNDWHIARTQWCKQRRRWGRFHFANAEQLQCLGLRGYRDSPLSILSLSSRNSCCFGLNFSASSISSRALSRSPSASSVSASR